MREDLDLPSLIKQRELLASRIMQDEALWFYRGFHVAETKEEQAYKIMHPLSHCS